MKTEMPGGLRAGTAVIVMTRMLVMIRVVIVAVAVLSVHHVRCVPGAVRVAA